MGLDIANADRLLPPDPNRKVRVGLLGVGNLGQHHARILAALPEVHLVGIVDSAEERARKFATTYDVAWFREPQELFTQVEAVVIATPTPSHFALADQFLQQGIHCFVEKPLTESIAEAESLIESARQKDLILQAGHVERFNPAVVEMVRHARDPLFIEANRLGPYDPRTSHIGVILDLMIHDIDITLALTGDRVTRLEAVGAKLFSEHEDIVKATLHFSRGARADLVASRASVKKYRKIRVFQKDAYISLDYSEKSLKIFRKKKPRPETVLDFSVSRPRLEKREPLERELSHFLQCIVQKKPPLVAGQHGRDALELALEIRKSLVLHDL